MQVWRLKVHKSAVSGQLVRLDAEFLRMPKMRLAEEALAVCQEEARSQWSPLALLGYFLKCYERRFRRPWKGTTEMLETLNRDLSNMMFREGAEDVCRAMDALFGPKMKWVYNPYSALTNKTFYYGHIKPVADSMAAEKRRGEQAEFPSYGETVGCTEVSL